MKEREWNQNEIGDIEETIMCARIKYANIFVLTSFHIFFFICVNPIELDKIIVTYKTGTWITFHYVYSFKSGISAPLYFLDHSVARRNRLKVIF